MLRFDRRQALQILGSAALAPAWGGSALAGADDTSGEDLGSLPAPTPGSFTLAALPDTQVYSRAYPEMFHAQTKWLAAQREARNIAAVLHLGDITDNNVEPQWTVAREAMARLDGVLPCFYALGNHDYGPNGNATTRDTLFNDYFPLEKARQAATFGGVYDKEPGRLDNSFHTFSAGDRDWLVISLEFGPRDDVVRWANEVAAAHADHAAILITHAFVYFDESRYDWATKGNAQRWNPHDYGVAKLAGGVNDGEELWNKLVARQPNFVMTLNGHVLNDGLGRVVSPNRSGNEVEQMLVNFQMKPQGGEAYLRLLEFQPDGKTVRVYDYSPATDRIKLDKQNRFDAKVAALKA